MVPPDELPNDLERLIPAVYDELRQLAARRLAGDALGRQIEPTSLVHQACLKLIDLERIDWKDRTHVLAVGARLMRQVLVDQARARHAAKRGGGEQRVQIDSQVADGAQEQFDLLALHDTLERLAERDARQARVVELRYFGGLTLEEIAAALGVSPRTAEEDWRMARAWLRAQLDLDGAR